MEEVYFNTAGPTEWQAGGEGVSGAGGLSICVSKNMTAGGVCRVWILERLPGRGGVTVDGWVERRLGKVKAGDRTGRLR